MCMYLYIIYTQNIFMKTLRGPDNPLKETWRKIETDF